MEDLISRRLLLEEINNEDSPYFIDITIQNSDTKKDIIDKTLMAYRKILVQMVNDIPTLNEWIPCDVRLPQEYSELFITTDFKRSYHVFYANGRFRFGSYNGEPIADSVVAWMPFFTPEPYIDKL